MHQLRDPQRPITVAFLLSRRIARRSAPSYETKASDFTQNASDDSMQWILRQQQWAYVIDNVV